MTAVWQSWQPYDNVASRAPAEHQSNTILLTPNLAIVGQKSDRFV